MSSNAPLATSEWINGLTAPAGRSDAVRLFCFPHAGGGASVFRSWVKELAPAVEVYPIQLPGREGRWLEPPLTRIAVLVPMLSEALKPLLRPPFAFFGHSMGAFIAFELARHLRRENRPGLATLIVSAARAPQIPDPDPPVHMMPADVLLEELKRYDGIPPELLGHPELVSLLLRTLCADMEMCETYAYQDEPPLACPITVYGGEQDKKVALDQLPPWQAQTSQAFRLRIFPGNHFFFVKEARSVVTQALREDLRHYASGADAASSAPPDQFERVVAGIWGEVLRVPQVGLDDNFFDLGGNSLLMVQAYSKLREASPTTLSLLDLFRYPTVRSLSHAMAITRVQSIGFGEGASTRSATLDQKK